MSLILVGGALSGAYARLLVRTESTGEASGQLAGTTVDMFLGGAVVILAVLAILRVASEVLIPINIIIIGVGLILNSAASVRLAHLESAVATHQSIARRIAEEMVFATASIRAAAGVAVLVLGILGVMGTATLVLALVAMIVAGAALVLNSTQLSGRIVNAMTR